MKKSLSATAPALLFGGTVSFLISESKLTPDTKQLVAQELGAVLQRMFPGSFDMKTFTKFSVEGAPRRG